MSLCLTVWPSLSICLSCTLQVPLPTLTSRLPSAAPSPVTLLVTHHTPPRHVITSEPLIILRGKGEPGRGGNRNPILQMRKLSPHEGCPSLHSWHGIKNPGVFPRNDQPPTTPCHLEAGAVLPRTPFQREESVRTQCHKTAHPIPTTKTAFNLRCQKTQGLRQDSVCLLRTPHPNPALPQV